MTDLTGYPNIGPKLAARLEQAGIRSYSELIRLGSVEAMYRIAKGRRLTGYNILYALEGACQGVRWHALAREARARVKADYERRAAASPTSSTGSDR